MSNPKLIPIPSTGYLSERDIGKAPILEATHLGIEFGGLKAVDDFNLTVGRTEIAGLIGPNGAGKTTVFNMLTKVYQPTHGCHSGQQSGDCPHLPEHSSVLVVNSRRKRKTGPAQPHQLQYAGRDSADATFLAGRKTGP